MNRKKSQKIYVAIVVNVALWLLLVLTPPQGFSAPTRRIKIHKSQAQSAVPVTVGHITPGFTLRDTMGKQQTLNEFQGRPVALFFFCGCPWCRNCAQTWGQFQRGGSLLPGTSSGISLPKSTQTPITLVVFSGDAFAARNFAAETGLDTTLTVVLPDPAERVMQGQYQAEPCPRVFILDRRGILRYTNDHKDDAPRQASEVVITSRALDALRTTSPVK